MIAVDTNLLVYAHREDSPFHEAAYERLAALAEGRATWAIPWPCVYEFLRVVTHPRVYHPPVPHTLAVRDIQAVLSSPSLVLLSETDRHAEVMKRVILASGATGNLMHDAHIAALCLEHGVTELITGDRDFHRFPGIRVRNPFSPEEA